MLMLIVEHYNSNRSIIMESKNGLEASRKSYKFNFRNFVSFLEWPHILLMTIIAIVSVAVLLLLLPYIVRDQSSVEVSSAMFSGSSI